MIRTGLGRRKFGRARAIAGALMVVLSAGGLALAWLESRAPKVRWERRSGMSSPCNAQIALVPDRDGDGVKEIAAVFTTSQSSAAVDGSCSIYSGSSGIELSKRSIRELDPNRIEWISADANADSMLCAWFESDPQARSGFVARLALDSGVRTKLVAFEALAPISSVEWARGALVRFEPASLAIVDHAANSPAGRLRIVDLRDGREISSRTGDELGFAFDSVRVVSTDSGRVDWLALSHRGSHLMTLDAEFHPRARWTAAYLVDALLVPDLDTDGIPDVVAALIDDASSEFLCAYSGASGAVLWKEKHDEVFTRWGASMDSVVAPRGVAPWIAVSGPSTFLNSHHDDAGCIDVFDLLHPKRRRIVSSSERFDFLGSQVLWANAASDRNARMLYSTAYDFENGQAVILAYAIELP